MSSYEFRAELMKTSLIDHLVMQHCFASNYDDKCGQEAIAEAGAVPLILDLCKSDIPEVQSEAADVIKVLARSLHCASILRACGAVKALKVRRPRALKGAD
jgi:hypothetical protein